LTDRIVELSDVAYSLDVVFDSTVFHQLCKL